jgi:hypothetical protein
MVGILWTGHHHSSRAVAAKELIMPTQQGDVSLLHDPVAQNLLRSPIPARLAYVWTDGTPRVVPIAFHWNGAEIVLGTQSGAPKMKALMDGAKVALSIDSDTFPYKVLMVRGSVQTEVVDGLTPEYEAACIKSLGEEGGRAWIQNFRQMCPRMARITVTPEWVAIQDFETRFPHEIERAIENAQAQAD